MKLGISITAGLMAASVCGPASALTFGLFLNASTEEAQTALSDLVTSGGHNPSVLDNLGNLGAVDVLWILNGDPIAQPLEMTYNAAALLSFVEGGGVLVYHDRNAQDGDHNPATNGPDRTLPGGGSIDFVFDDSGDVYNIDLGPASALVAGGPSGVIDGTTLDNGNLSSHGYASAGTLLPLGAAAIFTRSSEDDVVDFRYQLGSGFVYYSTIALDHYLALDPPDPNPPAPAFRNVYTRNVAAYAASLVKPVPEPATLLLLGGGLLGLGFLRRR